jgi:hypothetical protein
VKTLCVDDSGCNTEHVCATAAAAQGGGGVPLPKVLDRHRQWTPPSATVTHHSTGEFDCAVLLCCCVDVCRPARQLSAWLTHNLQLATYRGPDTHSDKHWRHASLCWAGEEQKVSMTTCGCIDGSANKQQRALCT